MWLRESKISKMLLQKYTNGSMTLTKFVFSHNHFDAFLHIVESNAMQKVNFCFPLDYIGSHTDVSCFVVLQLVLKDNLRTEN